MNITLVNSRLRVRCSTGDCDGMNIYLYDNSWLQLDGEGNVAADNDIDIYVYDSSASDVNVSGIPSSQFEIHTLAPTTSNPSRSPTSTTAVPSKHPTMTTGVPSRNPTHNPTDVTTFPTRKPSSSPAMLTSSPTGETGEPTFRPSANPN
jgi:hypothetical protein